MKSIFRVLLPACALAIVAGCGRNETQGNSDAPKPVTTGSELTETGKPGVTADAPPQPAGPATRPGTDSMGRPKDGTESSTGAPLNPPSDSQPRQQPPPR